MFKFLSNLFKSFEKAALAAHFARMGDYKTAQMMYKD